MLWDLFQYIGLALIVLASLMDWKASYDARQKEELEYCLHLQLRAIYYMIAAALVAVLILANC